MCSPANNQNKEKKSKEEYIYYPIFPCGVGRCKKSELKTMCEIHQSDNLKNDK